MCTVGEGCAVVRLIGLRPRLAARAPRLVAAPKRALADYRSPEWRALIARIIAKRGRQCERCGARGGRIYGDHKIELRDGGALLDENNVELLCAKCHGAKTEQAKRARVGLG